MRTRLSINTITRPWPAQKAKQYQRLAQGRRVIAGGQESATTSSGSRAAQHGRNVGSLSLPLPAWEPGTWAVGERAGRAAPGMKPALRGAGIDVAAHMRRGGRGLPAGRAPVPGPCPLRFLFFGDFGLLGEHENG